MAQSNEPATIEMNRAICEFIGWEFKQEGEDWFKAYHDGRLMWADNGKFVSKVLVVWFNYHEDWNKLMPVVEKIGNLTMKSRAKYNPDMRFRIEIVNGYTKIEGTGIPIIVNSSIEGSMLMATFKAVYQFITWYNQQKQTNE